jgi:hypothetical protein
MMRICRWTLGLLAVALVAGAHTTAHAQFSGSIVVHSSKPSAAKPDTFVGNVIFMTSTAITVRSRTNERMIRTFRYAAAIHDKMEKILDQGGYQYGDKVEVFYTAGSEVALRIKGKPSKPL